MQHMKVIIQLIDDENNSQPQTLVTHLFEVLDILAVPREERIDRLEEDTFVKGQEVMRSMLLHQLELLDQTPERCSCGDVNCIPKRDGHVSLKIASHLGLLRLERRIYEGQNCGTHNIPLNTALPEHNGMIITRRLQEWACLLPQELPFDSAHRLLGWITHEEEILCTTEIRQLVRAHGQTIRQAEAEEVALLQERGDLCDLEPVLVPLNTPRRHPSWPVELQAAVDAALTSQSPVPPTGVKQADWERILAYQRQAKEAAQEENTELRDSPEESSTPSDQKAKIDFSRLGPEIRPGQVVAATDEVQVRAPQRRRWWELRTARVTTSQGYRYLSGMGDGFLARLALFLLLCGDPGKSLLTLLGDGARWIRDFFQAQMALWRYAELILDWHHLKKKCYQLSSMICRSRKAKQELLKPLLTHLWQGQVDKAIVLLEAYRLQAKNEEKLNELMGYIEKHREAIPNYKERRKHRQFNSSAHAEKANDLLVARRQKHQGMHWSMKTSDALCALKTLILNGGWDRYWLHRQVLPLAS